MNIRFSSTILCSLLLFIFGTSLPAQSLGNQSSGNPIGGNSHAGLTLPHLPKVLQWEYLIWEVRVGGGPQKLPEYCLHFPNGSSRVYNEWGRAFRDRRVPVINSSEVDDVNALNSLGLMGWELITIAVKEEAGTRVLLHYFKRPVLPR